MLYEIILLDCLESWVRESLWRGIMKEFICGRRREMVFHLSFQVKLFSFASCVFIKCPQCVHTDCDLGTSRVLGFWRTTEKNIYERKVLSGTLLFQLNLDQSWQGLGNQTLNVGCVQHSPSEFMLWLYIERQSGDDRKVEKNKNNQGKKRKMRPGHSTVLPCWGAVHLLCGWNQEQMQSCDGFFAFTAVFVSIYWRVLPAQLCQLYLHFLQQYLFPCATWALCVFHGSLYPMLALKFKFQFLI